jgi:UDP-N-acetylmuramate dehydrogenase
MEFQGGVALCGYTTLRLGGPARSFVDAVTEQDVTDVVGAADRRGEPLLVLGGGSNLVVADEGFPGTVVHVATRGIQFARDGDTVSVTAAAGEDWDQLVALCASENLTGLECLSGIPGLAGATPIQNVGAYGQEVSETITTVRAYDRQAGEIAELAAADCGFGYRTSAFKRAPGRFVVLEVTFVLARDRLSRPVRYAELAAALGVAPGERVPLCEARSVVIGLRRGKGMVLDPDDPDTRSAGSFFTNPVLDPAQFSALEAAVRAARGPGVRVPCFPAEAGQLKVPAAWLIEHAGYGKGHGTGGRDGARISSRHTLALVNPGEATTASLMALAREIRDGVRGTFGVALDTEPVLVGITL